MPAPPAARARRLRRRGLRQRVHRAILERRSGRVRTLRRRGIAPTLGRLATELATRRTTRLSGRSRSSRSRCRAWSVLVQQRKLFSWAFHLRREERRHRENGPLTMRHVRVYPGTPVRLHAAAVQLLPDSSVRRRSAGPLSLSVVPRSSLPSETALHRLRDRQAVAVCPGSASSPLCSTALHPYSIWHDVHVNREILDGLLAALVFLIVLALASACGRWGLAAGAGADSRRRDTGERQTGRAAGRPLRSPAVHSGKP